ncbi:MAG: hypothetical protein QXU54_00610 [Candidatus Micrarchaeia archaeon]
MGQLKGLNPELLRKDVERAKDIFHKRSFSRVLVDHHLNLYFTLSSMLNHVSLNRDAGRDSRALLNLALYHNNFHPKSLPAELRPDLSELLQQFLELKKVDENYHTSVSKYADYISNNLPLFIFRMIDLSLLPLNRDVMVRVFGYNSSKVDREIENIAHAMFYIYAPVADIFKQAQLCARLKDNSTEVLYPLFHSEIKKFMAENIQNLMDSQRALSIKLSDIIMGASLFDGASFVEIGDGEHPHLKSRIKSTGSIVAKMISRDMKPSDVRELHDLVAFTVVTKDSESSQKFVEHLKVNLDLPNSAIEDFLDRPRKNGYRAIHVDVPFNGFSIEVQIRTEDVHRECEDVNGTLAHGIYKSGQLPPSIQERLSTSKDFIKEASPDQIKQRVLQENQPRISVYVTVGQKRKLIDLPLGAIMFDLLAQAVPNPQSYCVCSADSPDNKYSALALVSPSKEYIIVDSTNPPSWQTIKSIVPSCRTDEARIALRKLIREKRDWA